jgi:hypothetical protein
MYGWQVYMFPNKYNILKKILQHIRFFITRVIMLIVFNEYICPFNLGDKDEIHVSNYYTIKLRVSNYIYLCLTEMIKVHDLKLRKLPPPPLFFPLTKTNIVYTSLIRYVNTRKQHLT